MFDIIRIINWFVDIATKPFSGGPSEKAEEAPDSCRSRQSLSDRFLEAIPSFIPLPIPLPLDGKLFMGSFKDYLKLSRSGRPFASQETILLSTGPQQFELPSGKKISLSDLTSLSPPLFPKNEAVKAKTDRDFKYIDNALYGKCTATSTLCTKTFGQVSTDDTVVIKVKQPDGTWAEKGVTVSDFIFNPKGEYKFDKDLDTPKERLHFLTEKTGKSASLSEEEKDKLAAYALLKNLFEKGRADEKASK